MINENFMILGSDYSHEFCVPKELAIKSEDGDKTVKVIMQGGIKASEPKLFKRSEAERVFEVIRKMRANKAITIQQYRSAKGQIKNDLMGVIGLIYHVGYLDELNKIPKYHMSHVMSRKWDVDLWGRCKFGIVKG